MLLLCKSAQAARDTTKRASNGKAKPNSMIKSDAKDQTAEEGVDVDEDAAFSSNNDDSAEPLNSDVNPLDVPRKPALQVETDLDMQL